MPNLSSNRDQKATEVQTLNTVHADIQRLNHLRIGPLSVSKSNKETLQQICCYLLEIGWQVNESTI